MNKPLVTLLVILCLIVISCKKNGDNNLVTSGRIDYSITYLNTDLDKKTRGILPSRMRLEFNKKHAINLIDGFMGMYKLNSYTHFGSRKCSTVLKVLDKHYLFEGGRDEQMCCFDRMEDMEIVETAETKTIAGFLCKKALVTLPSSGETFNIYYTEEIDLKNANVTNPYKKVKGVLMEFELDLLYLEMRFVAQKYQPIEDTDFAFKISEKSKLVSRDQMTTIFNKLME
jgi:GLPGLI family protein